MRLGVGCRNNSYSSSSNIELQKANLSGWSIDHSLLRFFDLLSWVVRFRIIIEVGHAKGCCHRDGI